MPTHAEVELAKAVLVLVKATYLKDVGGDAYREIDSIRSEILEFNLQPLHGAKCHIKSKSFD